MSSWRLLSLLALTGVQDRLPYEGSVNPVAALGRLDVSCLLKTWRIKGVLWCPQYGDYRPCLWVENAYPCGLLEVVRQPLKSHVLGFPSGLRTTSGHKEDETQFGEARVFTYVPPLGEETDIPIAVPRGSFSINYISELDSAGWRTGLVDLLFARPDERVGAWGCMSPRSGFVKQPSEPLAAHLQAVRAGSVAARPWGRVVIQPYPYEPRVGHRLQMIAPVVRPCVTIGSAELPLLEAGAGSPHGAYLFAHWGLFERCRRCLPTRYLPPRPP